MLLHLDGTALYTVGAQAVTVGKASAVGAADFRGRLAGAFTGSYAFGFTTIAGNSWVDKVIAPSGNTVIIGCRLKAASWSASQDLFGIWGVNRGSIPYVNVGTNTTVGSLSVTLSNTVLANPSFTTSNGTWDYYELKVVSGTGTTGRIVLRVNGTTLYDSGATLSISTNMLRVFMGAGGWSNQCTSFLYSDIYVCDGSGTLNNDFLGDTRVETLYPSADGAHGDFTAPAGTNMLTANQWGLETGATTGWVTLAGTPEKTALNTALTAVGASTISSGSSATFAASTSFAYEGTHSLITIATFGGGPYAWQTTAGTGGVAVSPNTAYSIATRATSPSGGTGSWNVGVIWYDSGGTVISANVTASGGNSNGPYFATAGGSWTSPSNAAYAAVALVQQNANCTVYFDCMGLYANSLGIQFRAPSDTSHTGQVNDPYADGDGTFLVASTVGNTESFAMADLISTSGTPIAVLATSVVRKETPTPRTVSNLVRLSATDYVGTAASINNDLAFHGMTTIWETNPNTSAAWTISNVNALEAGIQLES